ncbi:hypothetical protein FB446DRAFT_703716 [Lentinula raphanica]|nr:hypothetical protein FB446DRAFT_703716 [Lentinula raphanica]
MSIPFSFQSERGHALISQIVRLYAPFQPHDYVLEGVGALLDGKDLIAVTPTGSGKTGYIAYTALVVCELTRHPENYPEVGDVAKKFPNDPLILCTFPFFARRGLIRIEREVLELGVEASLEEDRGGEE